MLKNFMEDKMLKANVENKSAVELHGLKPGASKVIEVDRDGTPLDRDWRRRKADAVIDGCVEITLIKAIKKEFNKSKLDVEN